MEEDGIRQIASALDAVYNSSSTNQARSEASAVCIYFIFFFLIGNKYSLSIFLFLFTISEYFIHLIFYFIIYISR